VSDWMVDCGAAIITSALLYAVLPAGDSSAKR
jgi:hypothetical protein